VQELFHLSLVDDWAAAQRAGEVTDSTRGLTLAEEGYIHCSFADQVAGVAERFYGNLATVVLLRIDPALIASPIVVEDLVGSGVEFPHVYGPIPVAAVAEAVTVAPSEIGR
jgi:glutathione S-transferase